MGRSWECKQRRSLDSSHARHHSLHLVSIHLPQKSSLGRSVPEKSQWKFEAGGGGRASTCNNLGLPFVLYMMVKASRDQLQRLARLRV